ncbi:MAG: 2-succinyl-5-enolpyruvyl-6-hydroxy-3-cyclohexene-1-carboxylic-acid synthase [Flavobacteriaceae bacterium]
MKYSSIPSAQAVVQHCKAKGIQNVVISPGSRNAPLTIGFTEDPYFKCFSIVDERSAGFFALGIAQQIRMPVVLTCTSGSALLNYYPAIAEAFYSDIPLIVISADRPLYKIDVGDGQTIRQDQVFNRHIAYSANLRQDVDHVTEKVKKYAPQWLLSGSLSDIQTQVEVYNAQELSKAMGIALDQETPVHINVPFEEPLYNISEQCGVMPEPTVEKIETPIRALEMEKFQNIWNASKRKMVLVGVYRPKKEEQELLIELAKDPSVVVLTETTSNLSHSLFFPSIDSIIAPIEKQDNRAELFEKLKPELLLTFGGFVVSKKIKAFLREYSPEHHWHVALNKSMDTYFSLTHHFKMDTAAFLSSFHLGTRTVESTFFSTWNAFRTNYEKRRKAYIDEIAFSDMKSYAYLLAHMPKAVQLHLANSSAVRYAQLFEIHHSISVHCNRGTSGIDGSTSTAVGAALHCTTPTVLITGDLSFFYDSNGLWNRYLRPDFRIIVINNGGGGIFRILPGKTDSSNFETYFETSHNLNARNLCEMFNIGYRSANDMELLKQAHSDFYDISTKPQLLEIFTPRLINDKILLTYFDFISSKNINH